MSDTMPKFYDVSLEIKEEMIVYPGNPHPQIRLYASIPMNKTNESLICIGSHTGSHVDTKKHLRNDGAGSAALPLDAFYGKCKVFDLTNVEKEIHRGDLQGYSIKPGDIILLKTKNSQRGYQEFREDYVHVKLDAAKYLVDAGVKTLGFDYLSVKKFEADDDVHQTLIENLTLFEGLNLAEVPEGEYTFVGFPLRLDSDAAPARVILIENHTG
ncbi:MAG TPA: cyclase family protein [Candidatus Bathyarchaeota archaeon]|nr:cyclase family protein [Candidatus Bathyarchaeota archaeon]